MAFEATAKAYCRTISVSTAMCKGCGICVALCPGVLSLAGDGKVSVSNQSLCTGCRNCENHCPDYAIFVKVA